MCRYKDIFKFTIYVEYLQKFMHRYFDIDITDNEKIHQNIHFFHYLMIIDTYYKGNNIDSSMPGAKIILLLSFIALLKSAAIFSNRKFNS